jgi:hypothetical protein
MERGFTTAPGLVGGDKTEAQEGQLLFVAPRTTPAGGYPACG